MSRAAGAYFRARRHAKFCRILTDSNGTALDNDGEGSIIRVKLTIHLVSLKGGERYNLDGEHINLKGVHVVELGLKDVVRIIRRRLWVIALLAVIGGGAAGVYSYVFTEPVYQAVTKMVVHNTAAPAEGVQPTLTLNELNAQTQLIATYKEIIVSPWIANAVAESYPQLGLSAHELAGLIEVDSVQGTQVMSVKVRGTDYRQAAEIANAVSATFIGKIPELYQIENVRLLSAADESQLPSPLAPNPLFNVIVAVILSLLIGTAIAFLLEYWDESLKTEEDVERALGLPTLIVIGQITAGDYRAGDRSLHAQKAGDYVATHQ